MEGEAAGGGWFQLLLPLLLMFAVFYFLLIRPQQKKQRERNAMLLSVALGDRVTTIGGLHGKIIELTDDIVVLQVNEQNQMTYDRSAISSIVEREGGSNQLT